MSLDPQYVGDVLSDIRRVGKATGEEAKAETLAARMQDRIDAVVDRVSLADHKPKVLHTEWVDPLMCGGHWVPEMVEMAGGVVFEIGVIIELTFLDGRKNLAGYDLFSMIQY